MVGDLARSVRFRWFDQPPVDAERADVLAGVRDELTALAADGDLADRADRIEALAAIPEQIVRFLAERLERRRAGPGADARGAGPPALPRVRPARPPDRSRPAAARSWSPTTPSTSGPPGWSRRSAPSPSWATRPATWPPRSATHVAQRAAGHEAVVDLYLHWPDAPESADAASEQLAAARRRRCRSPATYAGSAVAVCAGGEPAGRLLRVPPRPTDGGVAEDDLTRGVHPMVGRRLNLWRLRNFHVTRIEAPEDVLLYECVARENPADRRLVALAQVRQLAVVRDEEGRVTGLPHAERAVENCLEAIRRTRVARGARAPSST